jgi:hypothetical protein
MLTKIRTAVRPLASASRPGASRLVQGVRDAGLMAAMMAVSASAHAQQVNGLVAGVCKTAQFVSNTVLFAVLGLAVTVYGLMYAVNAMREGSMESVVRVSLGGGVSFSAVAIVANIFGSSC